MFTDFDLATGPVPLRIQIGPANGPPLVMWHGVGRQGSDFLALVPALSTRWQMFLVDHRGHGFSGRAPGRYRVIEHTDDAVAVLNWLDRPALLYGHSLGALVAAAAAAHRPSAVHAVILEDPPSAAYLAELNATGYFQTFQALQRLAGSPAPILEIAHALGDTVIRSPHGLVPLSTLRDASALRFMAYCLKRVDGQVFAPALAGDWMTGYDEQRVWQALSCPVLLLRGDPNCGGMFPASDLERMQQNIADLTAIDFPGTGHLIHATATEMTVRHLLNFLESLS